MCRGCLWLSLGLLGMMLLTSCGYHRTMSFPSPSRRHTIEIWMPVLADEWDARIELVSRTNKKSLHEYRREALIYFVHVYWSPDESVVGVMTAGASTSRGAWDTGSGRPVAFQSIESAFRRSIVEKYHVPLDRDALEWAAGEMEARDAFFKLHPEIRVSYRKLPR